MKNQIEKLQEKINAIKAVREEARAALMDAALDISSRARGLDGRHTGKSEKAAIKRALRAMERAANVLIEAAEVYTDEN